MRLVGHSVVVCTSMHPPERTAVAPGKHVAPPGSARPRAMTMSSFTSLTLTPTPLVTFNVATPSRSLDAIGASGMFNVHLLAGDVAGAKVADWFSKPGESDNRVAEGSHKAGYFLHRLANGVGGAEAEADSSTSPSSSPSSSPSPSPSPSASSGDGYGFGFGYGFGQRNGEVEPPLLGGPGILYALRCKLFEEAPTRGLIKVRDHVIVVGEVVEIIPMTPRIGDQDTQACQDERYGLMYIDRRYRGLGVAIEP
jgi:flavin reductase (DIM6/NTAB) family NADH-FMN oxidoreductase RutF